MVALLCGGGLLGSAMAAQGKAKAPAAPAAATVREIRLVHAFGPAREEALRELVARFNESSRDYRVSMEGGGWQEGDTPHLMILQDAAMERFVAGKPRFKPLFAVMREAGAPLKALRAPAMMMRATVDTQGRLLALPVGLSTPVLYINREAFQRVGLDPDLPLRTWFDLQQALGRLAQGGSQCPYTVSQPGRVMIENTSAWHNEPVSARRGRAEALSFNGMLQVKHVAMMASWHRARYLRIFNGGEQDAERQFTSGECAVIAAPSASWTEFRRGAGFELGILPLPFHDDFPGAPQNTLADGAALWVAAGKRPAEYKAIARFIGFWLQPDSQIAWQRASGYLPLNRAGLLAATSELLGQDLENVRVAVSQLTSKPPTAHSGASSLIGRTQVRDILDEELQAVWADRKPAKEALDTAVARAQALVPAR